MKREIKEVVRDGGETVFLQVDAGDWDLARISLQAKGAAGSALVLAPSEFRSDNFTLNDGSALIAPGSGDTLHVAIGPGTMIGVPLPHSLAVGMTATGGTVSIRVELSRWTMEEDNERARALFDFRKLIESIIEKLTDLATEIRALRKR